ncbi:lipoprotein-releasing ABC transporter permease subunit [Marinibactrum halimedae]|uniref:Lipoprotein-releasing ABC transporter permease subunit n=1 Tax=Marinibactrum halimedae TaxID=1444977 RepID=A0AA37T451_9GAMM|nr:lipoprotein-releasing ABC transporter permease subunit [Marinibactrum halimedae]MCD9461071.1 lipoprotein-releasing ABC transporter permease subunit [Marinibactrum halimedae]GLS26738.1 hypothetical protein GCM10007877_24560 [Marinibactrum halimedae]
MTFNRPSSNKASNHEAKNVLKSVSKNIDPTESSTQISEKNSPFGWYVGLRFAGAKSSNKLVNFISAISIFGLVLGVALLVVVVSIMNGFDRELRERILSVMPQVSVYHREGVEDWPTAYQQMLDLRAAKSAQAIAPFVHLEGMISINNEAKPALVYGVDPELEPAVSGVDRYLSEGALASLAGQPHAIILGSGLANSLDLEVGDGLTLVVPKPNRAGKAPGVRRLKLIEILHTGTELDHSFGVMHIDSASDLSAFPGKVSGFRWRIQDLFSAPELSFEIMSELPYGYYTSDWTRTHGNLHHAIQMSTSLVNLLLVLIIGIAVFNIVSTLVMAVVDKHSDIAILRTLGAGRRDIMAIFMVQGGLIGIVGTAVGLVVGILLTFGAQPLLELVENVIGTKILRSDVYPVSYLPTDIRLSDLLFIAFVSITLSILASLYPAWRASRVQPAEALRLDI